MDELYITTQSDCVPAGTRCQPVPPTEADMRGVVRGLNDTWRHGLDDTYRITQATLIGFVWVETSRISLANGRTDQILGFYCWAWAVI